MKDYTHQVLTSVNKGTMCDVIGKAKEFYSIGTSVELAIKILNK